MLKGFLYWGQWVLKSHPHTLKTNKIKEKLGTKWYRVFIAILHIIIKYDYDVFLCTTYFVP